MFNLITMLIFSFWALMMFSCSSKDTPFIVSSPGITTHIVINDNEDELVKTAANLFSDDIFNVSGKRPEFTKQDDSKYLIKVGTIGINKDFDKVCKEAGIDVKKLQSQWEAYCIKVVTVSNESSLLVVGSTPRGTAYGLMELSRKIGVSPWYWWADVHPVKREIVSLPADLFLEDAPKVKFRGIFLNDEDWGLQPWAAKTFEPETGDVGPKTYAKIFELLLRLKANAIWPAMHDCTRAFFTYPDNIKMADKYGIWVGSSHCEPMLRNNVDEWHRWSPPIGERGDWNFDKNPEQITEYWKQRIDAAAQYDGIYTVGMRGIHDGSMPGGENIEEKVDILNRVLDTQRNLLTEITGSPITEVPQIFCPYKEVLQLYKAGANIPDDVTIMWADDNYGYIRQLSNEEERKRSGGAGVYYHLSYWGRPHDYLWLESIPVSLIWEEMNKAYHTNAKDVWIVNVGDIKPNEVGMNFFLDMAWNPDQFTPETLNSYYTDFAEKQFGKEHAEEIGEILQKYFQLGFSRKPENLGWNEVYPNNPIQDPEFSLFTNGDEVQQRIDAYDSLEKQVEELYAELPNQQRESFYQLVAYKVIGASNMNKKILYAYKSRVYAKQGRTSAGLYAQKAREAFEKIKQATSFYNDSLADGKWLHMMTYNPRNLPVFDMTPTGSYVPSDEYSGEIVPEGYSSANEVTSEVFSLPTFNSLTNRSYFVDVINKGIQPLKWEVEADDWIRVSKISGQTENEERVWVSIDWNLVPASDVVNSVVRFKLNGSVYPVNVEARKLKLEPNDKKLFVEDNGVVSIEAEDYTVLNNTTAGNWQTIQGLGRENDAVGAHPVTAKAFDVADAESTPVLSYDFFSTSNGEAKLYFYCIPTQPINEDYQLRFSVSIDNGDPIIVNAVLKEEMDENNPEWKNNVLNSVTIQEVKSKLQEQGNHSLKIRMIDPGVVIDKIEIWMKDKKNTYFGAAETLLEQKNTIK